MMVVFSSDAVSRDIEQAEAKHRPKSVPPSAFWIWEEVPDSRKRYPLTINILWYPVEV
jgi:hypothetical protein